jgi:hypothetical protein
MISYLVFGLAVRGCDVSLTLEEVTPAELLRKELRIYWFSPLISGRGSAACLILLFTLLSFYIYTISRRLRLPSVWVIYFGGDSSLEAFTPCELEAGDSKCRSNRAGRSMCLIRT